MAKLEAIERQVLASPDQQISLTDPDCRSMATSGRGSGVIGYNVQTAVDTEHHLIVAHEVTNVGTIRPKLPTPRRQRKLRCMWDELEAVAVRGYFDGEEILACDRAGITVTLPKRMTSGAKSEGSFGKQDFVYLADENVYRCPAGERLKYYYTNEEKGQATPLLDDCVPHLRAESEMHQRAAAAEYAMGARGGGRGSAGEAR